MPTNKRRADARRRAWGRGPVILRFEPLEDRQLLATNPLADLVGGAFDTLHNLAWGDTFHAKGVVINQGTAAVSTGFHVNIYASPTPGLGPQSVLLGQATLPPGLQPGGQAVFDQVVQLPAAGLQGVDASGSIYVATLIDPDSYVPESNKVNNSGVGQGYDTSVVTLTPHLPSSLSGASLGVYPDQTQWGQAIQVTAQVQNSGPGDAPATRARVVLTPSGFTPGGAADVTVGSINIPAIPANQTAPVSQAVTLPQFPPAVLLGSTQFTLSVMQDADFVTDNLSPHSATRGLGFDQIPVVIALPANYAAGVNVPRPDLTATQISAPSLPLTFGQPFQVTAKIQNSGSLDAGPFRVRFLLVGTNGSFDSALFLGDATVSGLKAGFGQDVVQTLTVPTTLPAGVSLNSGGVARVAVIVDPEHVLDDANPSNNAAVSGVVSLGTSGAATATTRATTTAPAPIPTPPKTPTTPIPTPSPQNTGAGTKKKVVPKLQKHTLSHNFKVFPSRVSHYVHDLIKKI